jgi:hypothetical protein
MRLLPLIVIASLCTFAHAQSTVKVDETGVAVEVPGVDIDINEQGVDVDVPGVDVEINENGVGVALSEIDIDVPVETNVVEGRAQTRLDAPAPSELTNISVSVGTKSHQCRSGEGVEISSTSSVYTITGPCDTVRVKGTGNVVTVAQVRRVELSGTGNSFTWGKALVGDKPITQVSGIGNVIGQE